MCFRRLVAGARRLDLRLFVGALVHQVVAHEALQVLLQIFARRYLLATFLEELIRALDGPELLTHHLDMVVMTTR